MRQWTQERGGGNDDDDDGYDEDYERKRGKVGVEWENGILESLFSWATLVVSYHYFSNVWTKSRKYVLQEDQEMKWEYWHQHQVNNFNLCYLEWSGALEDWIGKKKGVKKKADHLSIYSCALRPTNKEQVNIVYLICQTTGAAWKQTKNWCGTNQRAPSNTIAAHLTSYFPFSLSSLNSRRDGCQTKGRSKVFASLFSNPTSSLHLFSRRAPLSLSILGYIRVELARRVKVE